MEKDQAFVEMVVKELVDNPGDVKTERSVDEMGVLVSLTVNTADMGKIIGKEGRNAKAIRTLLRVIGAKNNARVNLKIVEPEGSTHQAAKATDEQEETPEVKAPVKSTKKEEKEEAPTKSEKDDTEQDEAKEDEDAPASSAGGPAAAEDEQLTEVI